jgi:hypothetical protein
VLKYQNLSIKPQNKGGVTVEGAGWEIVDKISSLLLFWFMEASLLMVVDNIDSFCMK